jgi:xanthosine utilization system XapX-like protein
MKFVCRLLLGLAIGVGVVFYTLPLLRLSLAEIALYVGLVGTLIGFAIEWLAELPRGNQAQVARDLGIDTKREG